MDDATAREDAEQKRRRRRRVDYGAIAVIVAALIAVFGPSIVGGGDGTPVTVSSVRGEVVPSVRGEVEAIARSKLGDRGFRVYVGGRRFSARPRGEVIGQDPAGGTSVGAGSAVALVVSKGEAPAPCVHPPIHTASIRGMASFTTLRTGATVGPVSPAQGTYRNLAPGTDLWVFVFSVKAFRFYPQSDRTDQPAVLLPGGRFHSAAFFGGANGESYEVMIVLARDGASRFLSETLRRWAQANDFPGLDAGRLPSGLDEKACVTVKLRR